MFRQWLKENHVEDFDFSGMLIPAASDRAYWEQRKPESVIRAAETYLGYEWPLIRATAFMALKGEGNRLKQENPHFARRQALCALLLGEVAEYRGRFLPDIVDGVFAICEETFWGVSAHWKDIPNPGNLPDSEDPYIDLFAGETASLIVLTAYMLKDELAAYCPEILKRMQDELEKRIIKPYLSHNDFWWMGYEHDINNWNPWILSNILTVALLSEIRESTRKAIIHKAIFEIQRIYDYYPADGGCDEGVSYWGVSGATVFEFCEQLYLATDGKINFYDDEKIRRIAEFPMHTYITDKRFANFADCGPRGAHKVQSLLYLFGKRIGNLRLMTFAKDMLDLNEQGEPDFFTDRSTNIRRKLWLLAYYPDILVQPSFVPEEEYIYPDLQNAFVHGSTWYFAAKGGDNDEGHNHNDVGSFLAYDGNRVVLADPGCGVYTAKTFSGARYEIWHNRSEWHNLPIVNGVLQKNGPSFRTDAFALTNGTVSVSFAKAYPQEAELQKLERTISQKGDTLTLSDEFTFTQERNTVTECFITPLPVEIENGRAILDGCYIITADQNAQITADAVDFEGDSNLRNNWQTDHMNRVKFTFTVSKQAKINYELRKKV